MQMRRSFVDLIGLHRITFNIIQCKTLYVHWFSIEFECFCHKLEQVLTVARENKMAAPASENNAFIDCFFADYDSEGELEGFEDVEMNVDTMTRNLMKTSRLDGQAE